MLYQRYSNPLTLLEQMLSCNRLAEFIDSAIGFRYEEIQEKTQWEYYLHRVYDMSFESFVKQYEPIEPVKVDMEQVETTVKASMDILDSLKL